MSDAAKPASSDSISLALVSFSGSAAAAQWQMLGDYTGLSPEDLKKLQLGLEPYARSAIVEDNYICKDFRNVFTHFYSKRFLHGDSECRRIHFFSADLPAENIYQQLRDPGLNEHYIGYCVVRPTPKRSLGRSIFDPRRIGLKTAGDVYCLTTPFKVHLAGATLCVEGFPYMSQDSEVTLCAHVALWGVCRFLSERYSIYRELYPYDFVAMTSTYRGRVVPYRGMTYADFSEILVRFGCHPIIVHQPSRSSSSRDEAYAYVESGFPALASTGNHVVTVVGHTLARERPVQPDADGLINSRQFVDSWLVVDDNAFPYRRLLWDGADPDYGALYRQGGNPESDLTFQHIENLIFPLPERVFLTADRAYRIFRDHILDPNAGYRPFTERLAQVRRGAGLVIRQFITTGVALKREALSRHAEPGGALFTLVLAARLPRFVWVMELATLTGYRYDHRCIGEIVIDATANEHSEDPVLYTRVGSEIIVGDKTARVPGHTGEFRQFSHNFGSPLEATREPNPTGR